MASGGAVPRRAPPLIDPPGYARHRPEETLLYQLVEQHYPAFVAAREVAGRPLPKHVRQKFEAYLKYGRLEWGFLRVRCESCHAEKLVAFSCKGRAICPSCRCRLRCASCSRRDPEVLTHALGIVYQSDFLLPSREGSPQAGARSYRCGDADPALRLGLSANVHFHMLFLDGAYLADTNPPVFRRIAAPTAKELQALVERIG